jgi:hypothetical protein
MENTSQNLESKIGSATSNPIGVWSSPIVIDQVRIWFETKPDTGVFDLGTDDTDPDEVVDAFNVATLANHVPSIMSLVGTVIPAGTRLWAKMSPATSTAGVGGCVSIMYHYQ